MPLESPIFGASPGGEFHARLGGQGTPWAVLKRSLMHTHQALCFKAKFLRVSSNFKAFLRLLRHPKAFKDVSGKSGGS